VLAFVYHTDVSCLGEYPHMLSPVCRYVVYLSVED
jgi:hypothetical protein